MLEFFKIEIKKHSITDSTMTGEKNKFKLTLMHNFIVENKSESLTQQLKRHNLMNRIKLTWWQLKKELLYVQQCDNGSNWMGKGSWI